MPTRSRENTKQSVDRKQRLTRSLLHYHMQLLLKRAVRQQIHLSSNRLYNQNVLTCSLLHYPIP